MNRDLVNCQMEDCRTGTIELGDENRNWKRICRAKILLHMMDVLNYELNGQIPGLSAQDSVKRAVYDRSKYFLNESEEVSLFCVDAGIPKEKVLTVLHAEDKRATLTQLNDAYRAVTRDRINS